MTVDEPWRFVLAIALLVGLAVLASWLGGLHVGRQTVVASVRAVVQLALVSVLLVGAFQHLGWALVFVAVMVVIGVWTTAGRTGVRHAMPYVALAMLAGVLPVLAIVLGTGAVPLAPAGIIPVAGIVTGNMMTAHTLMARRCFKTLRDGIGQYEAALALGLSRAEAIRVVDPDSPREATMPANDQTRTVGLVTLPGAFVGVLLGGGSPFQAGAAQLLVLAGILAGQAVTVSLAHRLVASGRLLPRDLQERLRP